MDTWWVMMVWVFRIGVTWRNVDGGISFIIHRCVCTNFNKRASETIVFYYCSSHPLRC